MSDFLPEPGAADPQIAAHVGFRTIILKVQRDCNLNCSYCYVYNMADQSWRSKPARMSAATIAALSFRIREHVQAHTIPELDVLFHGGEPLLGGVDYLVGIKQAIEAEVPAEVTPNFSMQTNGLLLTTPVLNTLAAENIGFGISLDGPPEINDRFRRHRNGHGSHEGVIRNLDLIASHEARRLFAGFLCVVQVDADPEELLAYFDGIGAHRLDLLLPHGHWDSLPPGMRAPGDGRYARWLIRAFDYWFDHCPHIRIRYFADIVKLFLGGGNVVESLGLGFKSIIVVETDGAIEGLDTLRAVKESATDIGMDVRSHSFDDALTHPAVYSRFMGSSALCDKCRQCRHVAVCGGGYLPHRWSAKSGYLNTSVYCGDLLAFFQHVAARLRVEVSALA